MKKLLIATTNPAKFGEMQSAFEENGIKILGLRDFPEIKIVEETGHNFEENALLKVKGYFAQTNIPCLADDGGLMVDYLDGAPGVNSNRWLGFKATDQEIAGAILKKMEGVPSEKRTARFGGVMAFYDGNNFVKEENYVEGFIAQHPVGDIKPGFPYRSIFMVAKFGRPYSELSEEEDKEVGARQRNLQAIKPRVLELLK
jgi:XTP/dITP diphosphohydrolase